MSQRIWRASNTGDAHIHFEPESAAFAMEQTQMFWPSAGVDGHLIYRGRLFRVDQQGGYAARTVA